MRLALVLILVGAALALFLAFTGEPDVEPRSVSGPTAVPSTPRAATDERIPAPGPPEHDAAGVRSDVDAEQAFDDKMRARHGGLSTDELAREHWNLRRRVASASMDVGQPLISERAEELELPYYEGQTFADDVLYYVGPDSEQRLRVIVLDPTEHPALALRQREALWLAAELARRQAPEPEGAAEGD